MTLEYRIGDVRDRLAELPDGSIDLIVTSPPFLALRSYLPADHPDKHREIGSEPTPADFIDTLLGLTAEWGRILAPHGSICVELGDTYSGASAEGSDQRGSTRYPNGRGMHQLGESTSKRGAGWPLAKSLTGIPTLYPWSLAYGRNLLTGRDSPAGQWRVRNVIVWARPNPPVGALGDKFRPATSYITVACRGAKRYFDLDAVRVPGRMPAPSEVRKFHAGEAQHRVTGARNDDGKPLASIDWGGASPPLDWHADDHPEDGDWLWKLSTQPYKGSHYATYPLALPKRLIEAMCPLRVCVECGKPSERVVGGATCVRTDTDRVAPRLAQVDGRRVADRVHQHVVEGGANTSVIRQAQTLGWTDCGHNQWRTGIVLDPFAGSGTTLEAAQAVGRHAIGIDLDARNADLARERVGMFLEVRAA